MPVDLVGDGERVIRGSMRRDGTFRKDVRIKAGYVPQDEQPLYKSNEALDRRGYQKCPGLDESETKPAAPKSKSAKKNERRKTKKNSTDVDITLDGKGADDLADQLQEARLDDSSAAEPQVGGGLSSDEKKLRTLRKKLQQAEALAARKEAGDTLTEPEIEKLGKVTVWKQEITRLANQ